MTQATWTRRVLAPPSDPQPAPRRPASQSEPEGPQRSLCEPTRAATALHLTPAVGDEPHTTVRISRSRPRYTQPRGLSQRASRARPASRQQQKVDKCVVRTRAARRAMLAPWVSIWHRARRKSTFGMVWKVAGSAKCARCAFDSPPI